MSTVCFPILFWLYFGIYLLHWSFEWHIYWAFLSGKNGREPPRECRRWTSRIEVTHRESWLDHWNQIVNIDRNWKTMADCVCDDSSSFFCMSVESVCSGISALPCSLRSRLVSDVFMNPLSLSPPWHTCLA